MTGKIEWEPRVQVDDMTSEVTGIIYTIYMLECRPGRTPFWEYSIHGWSGLHLKIMCWGGNTLLSFIHISTSSMLCSCFRWILGSSSWKVFLDIFLYYFSVGFFSCSDGHSDICNKAVVYNTINVHSCFVLTLKYSKDYQRLIHDTQTRHASAIVFIHVMSQKKSVCHFDSLHKHHISNTV